MHVCLLPTEILLHIFTIGNDGRFRDFSAQLAVLARTCRKFKEPALDVLWKHLNGFKPLISCLPEGVSNRDRRGNLTLRRPLLAGEWRLIHQYARRVHSFTVSGSELDIIDNHVMQALMSAPSPTSIFPNLRSLRWCDDREHFFPLLRTLLGSTITSVRVGFLSNSSFAQSALLTSLGGRCPSIRELNCVCTGGSPESSDAICESLSGLRELSRLDTGTLSPQEFLRLASLPALKSLCFRLGAYDAHEMQCNSTPTVSPKLEEVDFTVLSMSEVEHFLRGVRLPSCRSARMYIHYDYRDLNYALVPYDPLHIPDFIVSLSECLSPALEKLHVKFEFNFTDVREAIFASHSYVLGFNAVAPLLPFNRLIDLRLDWLCTSAIDDASFKTLAQSWPQLEQFYFGGAACWLIPPSMTFTALFHLIQHCPRLHTIQMSFCATPVDYDNDPFFFETIPNEEITTLSVGMSPISDPCAVVYILLRLLPKLEYVYFLGWLDDDTHALPPFEDLEDGWTAVNEILADNDHHKLE
ncbi:uncharacterized protein BJ212DRAFT_1368295 [Suillus subaureus]|uniref:F-box domain-containing protein n=1 Tax=Suillus subaureus TaxID=48587 RepID=A0A9P7E7L1_9AGAM|nr:uncharacterized protein BJ212DRAFT_1368295 [Suillus subaureus]KAG1812812.1 hypothetical protein BJ212DRAFT_1368295 [Suillus subaureus]